MARSTTADVVGQRLEDIKLRRNDATFLDALGAPRIPDPTASGDLTRRFDEADITNLQETINRTRPNVWRRQPRYKMATEPHCKRTRVKEWIVRQKGYLNKKLVGESVADPVSAVGLQRLAGGFPPGVGKLACHTPNEVSAGNLSIWGCF